MTITISQSLPRPVEPTTTNECRICRGVGYVNFVERGHYEPLTGEFVTDEIIQIPHGISSFEVEAHYPMAKGWRHSSGYCQCKQRQLQNRRVEKVMEQDEVPDDVRKYTLNDFDDLSYAAQAVRYARQMITARIILDESDKIEKPGLCLIGPTGVGKSTLAICLFAELTAFENVRWINFNKLVSQIRATYESTYTGMPYSEMVDEIKKSSFLLLDDIGSLTRKGTYFEDAIEAVRSIFEFRAFKKMPTVVTTNLTKTQLYEQFGDRAISRLRGLCAFVTMNAPDFRAPGDRK